MDCPSDSKINSFNHTTCNFYEVCLRMLLVSMMRGNAMNVSGKVTEQITYCELNNYLLCIFAYISRLLATYSVYKIYVIICYLRKKLKTRK